MKNILIGLGSVLVIIAIMITVFTVQGKASDIYSAFPNATAETIDVNSETPIVYYFYQPDCKFCNSNKGNVTQFTKDLKGTNIEFETVDLRDAKNLPLWYSNTGEYKNPVVEDPNFKTVGEIQTIDDLKITGTPAAIYVNEGEVKAYDTASGIYDVFTMSLTDAGVEPTFDSEYKK